MSDIKVGDRVKVEHTYEAVVKCASKWGAEFDLALPNGGTVTTQPGDVVTKLPKVGDTIEGPAAYKALPIGAVVADGRADVNLRTSEGFVDSDGYHREALSAARTLVYLP